ncbi:MAG: cell wall hydrolase [Pararhizobium sp.]
MTTLRRNPAIHHATHRSTRSPTGRPRRPRATTPVRGAFILCGVFLPVLGGCTTDAMTTGSISPAAASVSHVDGRQRQCLIRAMYFESNRSSEDGMLAVGSVVMNRVASAKYPDTICGVVGQSHQFASGVMTRRISGPGLARAEKVADEILQGKRHRKVGHAMYFHTAGLKFHYGNMHYVAVAGGNAFYEKTSRHPHAGTAVADAAPKATPPASSTLPGVRTADATTAYTTAYVGKSSRETPGEQAIAAATN